MSRDDPAQEVRRALDRVPDEEEADRAWIDCVRDAYEPEPMTAAQRAAFDARLAERIERGRRRGWMIAVAGPVLLAAAATLLWIALAPHPDAGTQAPTLAEQAPSSRPESLRAWQHEVLSAADPGAASPSAAPASDLPAEYQALDSMFLAGANGDAHAR